MSNAEYMARRREQLRKDSKCHDCAAPIDLAKGVRCTACKDKNKDRKALWLSSERGKKITNRRAGRVRRRKKKRGICQDCPLPIVAGRTRCAKHLATNKVKQARYLDRKEAGVRVVREQPIVPIPEPKPWQRILRVAKRFDEVSHRDICEALEIDDDHGSVSHILTRLSRKGYLERVQGKKNSNNTAYVVTPEGRRAA